MQRTRMFPCELFSMFIFLSTMSSVSGQTTQGIVVDYINRDGAHLLKFSAQTPYDVNWAGLQFDYTMDSADVDQSSTIMTGFDSLGYGAFVNTSIIRNQDVIFAHNVAQSKVALVVKNMTFPPGPILFVKLNSQPISISVTNVVLASDTNPSFALSVSDDPFVHIPNGTSSESIFTQHLDPGWNWVTFHLEKSDNDINSFLECDFEDGDIINGQKAGTSSAYYYDSTTQSGIWFPAIIIQPSYTYKILVSSAKNT